MAGFFWEKLHSRIDRVDKDKLFHLLKETSAQKNSLQGTLEALGDGVVVLQKDGRVQFANRAALALLGKKLRHAVDALVWDLAGDPALQETLASEDLRGAHSVHREIQVLRPRSMLLSLDLIPVRENEGDSGNMALLIRDITDKRRMEERMARSEKLGALSVLAAGLAHEIGNPLNSINIHLQLMGREIKKRKGKDSLQKAHGIVQGEIDRLDTIVHRFLEAIRPLRPQLALGSVHGIVRAVINLMGPEFRARGITCRLDLDEGDETLLDEAQIKQALINILRNAVQAMPQGGALSVQTERKGGNIRVRIRDSGVGIPPEHLSRIFDPYFTTKDKGMGLGLMMTYRIVQEHGGEIEVQSSEGNGSTFVVILPVRTSHPKMISDKSRMAG